jgi:hypothetical protein
MAICRAQIVLATAVGHGTNTIMRLTDKSKPRVGCWLARYGGQNVDGLPCNKMLCIRGLLRLARGEAPGRIPLLRSVPLKAVGKTASATPTTRR